MKESREKVIKAIVHYQQNLERYLAKHEDAKMLHCINRLQTLPITVSHLEETGVGRTVNSLRKINGEVGDAARILVNKWKGIVEQDGDDADTSKDSIDNKSQKEKDKHTSSHYSDKPKSSSKDKHRENDEKRREKEKKRDSAHSDLKLEGRKEADDRYRIKTEKDIKKEVLVREEQHKSSSKRKYRSGSSEGESSENILVKNDKEIKKEKASSGKENRKDDYKSKLQSIKEEFPTSHAEETKFGNKIKIESEYEMKREYDSNDDEINDDLYKLDGAKDIKKEVLSGSDSRVNTDKYKLGKSSKRKYDSDSNDDSYDKKHKSQHKDDNKYQQQNMEESDNEEPFDNNYSDDNESIPKKSYAMHQSPSHRAKHVDSDSEEHGKETEFKQHSSNKSSRSKHSNNSDSEERVEKKKHKHKKHDKHENSDGESDDEKKKTKKSKHKEKSKTKDVESKHTKSDSKKHSDKHKDKSSKSKVEKSPDKSKSHSKKDDNKKTEPKPNSSKKSVSVHDGIDSGSGASFAEALGMLVPSTSISKTPSNKISSKKKTVTTPEKSYNNVEKSLGTPEKNTTIQTKKTEDSFVIPSTLINPPKLEPLDLNISSLLPPISTNYRPLGNNLIDAQNSRTKALNDTEALSKLMYAKNARTKVYSGNKTLYNTVPSLFELCIRILQMNIDALEYTGGVPYLILKPVLDRATPDQLFMLEHHNPYIIEESDELWEIHCKKEFRNKRKEELESYREMYMRCLDEREAKLKALTANIKLSQDKSIPIRQTKLAYVDSVVKPPRNIAKKQVKNGIEKRPIVTPSSRLTALATSGAAGQIAVPSPVRASSSSSRTSDSSFNKVKKAPLMQKTLQLMKGRFRR